MTRDAFERAKELDYDISAVEKLKDIINGCCMRNSDADDEHNIWLNQHNVTLCYLVKEDDRDKSKDCTAYLDKKFYCIYNYMRGDDIPVDLYKKLRDVIDEYIEGLEKEFENLKDGFEYESEG